MKNLVLYDTTLRDGAQTEGVTFSLEDKLAISSKLSDFGFHYIEGGWPASNPRDSVFFSEARNLGLKAKIAAFGMTSRSPEKDSNIEALLKTGADVITVFGKSWDLHVRDVLKTSNEENLKMISSTIEFLKSHGFRVFYDAEHFFDGYKHNPSYALRTLEAADGADEIILCDTNGGAMPWEVDAAAKAARGIVRKPLGMHAHNDCGMALMNSLAAAGNGFSHVQGTVNGLGERCGNLDWCMFLPVLGIKLGSGLNVELKNLMQLSRYVERMTGFNVPRNRPFVGESAFSHKGGVHIDAVLKIPEAYEHIRPEDVGNARSFGLSEQVGRAGIVMAAKQHGYHLDKDHPAVTEAFERIKQKQAFTDAELFLLLSNRIDGKKDPFGLLDYETEVSKSGRSKTEIKVGIDGEVYHEIAEGVGPVHSFDVALRKALQKRFSVGDVKLTNFRVRILNQEKATAASVEVFIEFRANGLSWSTTGISDDVIRASEEALINGYKYYLLKNRG